MKAKKRSVCNRHIDVNTTVHLFGWSLRVSAPIDVVFTNRKIIGRLKSNKMSIFKLSQAAIINITFQFHLCSLSLVVSKRSCLGCRIAAKMLLGMCFLLNSVRAIGTAAEAFAHDGTENEQINGLHLWVTHPRHRNQQIDSKFDLVIIGHSASCTVYCVKLSLLFFLKVRQVFMLWMCFMQIEFSCIWFSTSS